MDSMFLAIAGSQVKTDEQLKNDLALDYIVKEVRIEQNEPDFQKELDPNGKQYYIAGVEISATEAEEAIKSMNINLPKEYKKPRDELDESTRERLEFERLYGVNFDEAIDNLIEIDKKNKSKSQRESKHRLNLGPFEGRANLNEYDLKAVEAAKEWHPELFEVPPEEVEPETLEGKKKKKKKKKKVLVDEDTAISLDEGSVEEEQITSNAVVAHALICLFANVAKVSCRSLMHKITTLVQSYGDSKDGVIRVIKRPSDSLVTTWECSNHGSELFHMFRKRRGAIDSERRELIKNSVSLTSLPPEPELPIFTSLEIDWSCFQECLCYIDLSYNGLAGPIPEGLEKLTSLKSLYIQGNALDGELPNFLHRLPHLVELDLSDNRLEGTLAPLAGAKRLKRLEAGGNHLSGSLKELLPLKRLEVLRLRGNMLTGTLDEIIEDKAAVAKAAADKAAKALKAAAEAEAIAAGQKPSSRGSSRGGSRSGSRGASREAAVPTIEPDGVVVVRFPKLAEIDVGDNLITGEVPPHMMRLTQDAKLAELTKLAEGQHDFDMPKDEEEEDWLPGLRPLSVKVDGNDMKCLTPLPPLPKLYTPWTTTSQLGVRLPAIGPGFKATCSYPMYVMRRDVLLSLKRLISHEEAVEGDSMETLWSEPFDPSFGRWQYHVTPNIAHKTPNMSSNGNLVRLDPVSTSRAPSRVHGGGVFKPSYTSFEPDKVMMVVAPWHELTNNTSSHGQSVLRELKQLVRSKPEISYIWFDEFAIPSKRNPLAPHLNRDAALISIPYYALCCGYFCVLGDFPASEEEMAEVKLEDDVLDTTDSLAAEIVKGMGDFVDPYIAANRIDPERLSAVGSTALNRLSVLSIIHAANYHAFKLPQDTGESEEVGRLFHYRQRDVIEVAGENIEEIRWNPEPLDPRLGMLGGKRNDARSDKKEIEDTVLNLAAALELDFAPMPFQSQEIQSNSSTRSRSRQGSK